MLRLLFQTVFAVWLTLPLQVSASVKFDEPDWQVLVNNWTIYTAETSVAARLPFDHDIFTKDEINIAAMSIKSQSSQEKVKFISLSAMYPASNNTLVPEPVVLFCFGMILIILVRVGKRNKTRLRLIKVKQLIAAKIG